MSTKYALTGGIDGHYFVAFENGQLFFRNLDGATLFSSTMEALNVVQLHALNTQQAQIRYGFAEIDVQQKPEHITWALSTELQRRDHRDRYVLVLRAFGEPDYRVIGPDAIHSHEFFSTPEHVSSKFGAYAEEGDALAARTLVERSLLHADIRLRRMYPVDVKASETRTLIRKML